MRWSGWLLDNLGLKLFALLLAVLLYVHVYTDRTDEETLYFPLVLEQLPDSLSLASEAPATVGVRLRGTGKQLWRLRILKPPVRVSLAAVTPGTFQRSLGPADVPLTGAGDMTIVGMVDPSEVRVDVARRAVRRVPIDVPITGLPARGLVVSGRVQITPATARVTGPASWVARQETLRTEPVSIAGRRDTLQFVQALIAPPPWAHIAPGSVFVRVPIEAGEERALTLPIEVRGIRGELRADTHPTALAATWRGPASLAGAIDARNDRAVVDAGRRGRGPWTLRVVIEGPDAARLVPASDSVRVILR
jgi:YbbR domain-containing protein